MPGLYSYGLSKMRRLSKYNHGNMNCKRIWCRNERCSSDLVKDWMR